MESLVEAMSNRVGIVLIFAECEVEVHPNEVCFFQTNEGGRISGDTPDISFDRDAFLSIMEAANLMPIVG